MKQGNRKDNEMKQYQRWLLILALLTISLSGACTQQNQPTPTHEPGPPQEPTLPEEGAMPAQDYLTSNITRVSDPQISQPDLEALVQGNTAFAIELYQLLAREEGNLFYSPFSISMALAMTYAGASGETASQMQSALQFSLPQEKLHPAFNSLDLALENRTNDEQPFELNITNALWGQSGFDFQPDFLDTLALNYGAGMHLVDYAQSETARQQINAWVEEQTKEKIKDLIPEGALNSLNRLVLTNAIYFKAAWRYPFSEGLTSPAEFDLLDGSEISVETMRVTEIFDYKKAEDYLVVELPYSDPSLVMTLLVPDEEKFTSFESDLDVNALSATLENLEPVNMALSLPKFKVESSFSLNEALSALGMSDAFDIDKADFSGMTGTPLLYITSVVHKAFVDVNEEGTEAAAATGVIMGLKSMPAEPIEVKIDRPFLFLIRDRETGAILFLGRVTNPAK